MKSSVVYLFPGYMGGKTGNPVVLTLEAVSCVCLDTITCASRGCTMIVQRLKLASSMRPRLMLLLSLRLTCVDQGSGLVHGFGAV